MKESSNVTNFVALALMTVLVLAGIGYLIFSRFRFLSPISNPPVKEKQLLGPDIAIEATSPQPLALPAQYNTPPDMRLEKGKDYLAILHTNKGDVTLDLYEDKTPITTNNFVFLAGEKFYDGVRFHRIMKDFMVQSGDPLSKDVSRKEKWGTGGPGYKFADEMFDGVYTPGVLAMANSGSSTNGSQFFIMTGQADLPKSYVIFGNVADDASMTVLKKVAETPVTANALGEPSVPTEDVIIQSVEILTK